MAISRGTRPGVPTEAAFLTDMLQRIAALERASSSGSGGGGGGGVPIGAMIAGPWDAGAAPYAVDIDGVTWLQVRAQTVTDGALDYPDLAAAYPGWVSGNDLVLPAGSAKVLYFLDTGTPGATFGSNTITLSTAQMPSHTHSGPSHTHSGPSHAHSTNPDATNSNSVGHNHDGRYLTTATGSGGDADLLRPHDFSFSNINQINTTTGAHVHSTNLGATTSSSSGTGETGSSGTGDTGSAGSGSAVDVRQAGIQQRLFVRAL